MQAGDLADIARALNFAAVKHRHQRRKDAESLPYINHPIDLFHLLSVEAGITDRTVLMGAILHDTLEDTDTSEDELCSLFGPEISTLVAEVSDDKRLDKQTRKRLQIEHAADASPAARLIKLADKTCNLRDLSASPPAGWDLARRQDYFDWAAAVVEGLRGTHPVLEQLFDQACKERPQD